MHLVSPYCAFMFLLAGGASWQTQSSANDDRFDLLARRAATAVDQRPAEAVGLYQKALERRPTWAEGWFYLGASEYQMQHYGQARIAFARAAELAPQNGPAVSFLGLTEYQVGAYSSSLTHLERGTRLGMEGSARFSNEVHTHLAYLFCKAGRFGPALIELEPLAKAGDHDESVITAFGLAVLQRRELPIEIPASDRTLVTVAGSAVWSYYAEQPDGADDLFRKLVRDYPKRPGVHYAYGMFLVPRDPDLAGAELGRELEDNPKHLQALVQLSLLDLKRGELAKALVLGQRATQAGPDYALAHTVLGRALLKDGQTARAVRELQRAVSLMPQEALFHLYLEQAYSAGGQSARAQAEKSAFLRLRAASAADARKVVQPSLLGNDAELKALE